MMGTDGDKITIPDVVIWRYDSSELGPAHYCTFLFLSVAIRTDSPLRPPAEEVSHSPYGAHARIIRDDLSSMIATKLTAGNTWE